MFSRISAQALSTARMRALSWSLILILIIGIVPVGAQDASANSSEGALRATVTESESGPAGQEGTESVNDRGSSSASSSSAETPLAPAPVSAAGSNQEKEPNDHAWQATVIKPGVTYSGVGSGDKGWGDDDFFAIDVPAAGRATIDVTFPKLVGGTNVVDVAILNSRERVIYLESLDAADYDGSLLKNQGIFLPKGQAYVKIKVKRESPLWGKTYQLKVGLTAGNVELEPNQSTREATPVELGTAYSGSLLSSESWGDTDVFAVDLTAETTVNVTVKIPAKTPGKQIYELQVLDPREKILRHQWFDGSQTTASWDVKLPKGVSYVLLYAPRGTTIWGKTYTLNVSKTLSAAPVPTISGTAHVGRTLTAKPGTWKPSGVKFAYQWKRGGKNIKGATKSSYTVVKADVGKKITVSVTGSKSGFGKTTKTSKATTALDVFTTAPRPTMSGTATVGKTLTAKAGSWKPSGVKFAYQWKSNGKNIKGATKSSYTLPRSQKGKKITVAVTGTKKNFATVTKTSMEKSIT